MHYRIKCSSSLEVNYDKIRNNALFVSQFLFNDTIDFSRINFNMFTVSNHVKLLQEGECIVDRHILSFLLRKRFAGSVNSNIYSNKIYDLEKSDKYIRLHNFNYILNPLAISTVFTIIYDDTIVPIFSIFDNHSMYVKYLSYGIKNNIFLSQFSDRLYDLSFLFDFTILDKKNFTIKLFDGTISKVSGHARYIFILALFDIVDFTLWLNSVRFYLTLMGFESKYEKFDSYNDKYNFYKSNDYLSEDLDKSMFEHTPLEILLGLLSVLPVALRSGLRYKAITLFSLSITITCFKPIISKLASNIRMDVL
jgi:hypothetical protein